MRLYRLRDLLWITPAVLGLPSVAPGAFECPHPSQQIAQEVSEDVATLSEVTKESFQKKANTVTHDLYEKYPHADQVAIATTALSIFCQIVRKSSMPDAEKLDQLYRLEASFTSQKGISVPLDHSVGPECSTASAEVLRPIRALFHSWEGLDVNQYLAQWGPNAIMRSKYYVYKAADLGPHRRASFAQYGAVDIVAIDPKIVFADHTKAVIKNVYTMRFVKRDGKVIEERNIGESYVLECSAQDQKWLIRENNDYLSAD
jgi:hypothetical protein